MNVWILCGSTVNGVIILGVYSEKSFALKDWKKYYADHSPHIEENDDTWWVEENPDDAIEKFEVQTNEGKVFGRCGVV